MDDNSTANPLASAVLPGPELPTTSFLLGAISSLASQLQIQRNTWLILVLLILLPPSCYLVTTLRYYCVLFINAKRMDNFITPVAPYWLPFLRHTIPMAVDSASYIAGLA